MSNLTKKLFKGLLSLTLVFTTISTVGLDMSVKAAEEEGYVVSEYTPAYNGNIILENGNDGFWQNYVFPAATEFTYSADAIFEGSGTANRQSAALVFGIRNRDIANDGNAVKVNVHGQDGGVYGRAWGYATPGYGAEFCAFRDDGQPRPTDLSQKFRMIVKVAKDGDAYRLTFTTYKAPSVTIADITLFFDFLLHKA